jgi:phytoene synthase
VTGEEDLDAAVRAADPERWLSSRFIGDAEARADVVAVYAFDHQLARAERVASNSLIAEIRLVWWREALDEIFAGARVRAHPAATGLAAAVRRRALPRPALEAMIEGRLAVVDKAQLGLADAMGWAGAVAGSAAVLAADILGAGAAAETARSSGALWGLHWLARSARIDSRAAQAAIREQLQPARRSARALPVTAFPSIAHATLARASRDPGDFELRARLLAAVALGRI